jgi:polyphosphate kinase
VLKNILEIQLSDNVKARILDNELSNRYARDRKIKKIRSQVEIYNYLHQKSNGIPDSSNPEVSEVIIVGETPV